MGNQHLLQYHDPLALREVTLRDSKWQTTQKEQGEKSFRETIL